MVCAAPELSLDFSRRKDTDGREGRFARDIVRSNMNIQENPNEIDINDAGGEEQGPCSLPRPRG